MTGFHSLAIDFLLSGADQSNASLSSSFASDVPSLESLALPTHLTTPNLGKSELVNPAKNLVLCSSGAGSALPHSTNVMNFTRLTPPTDLLGQRLDMHASNIPNSMFSSLDSGVFAPDGGFAREKMRNDAIIMKMRSTTRQQKIAETTITGTGADIAGAPVPTTTELKSEIVDANTNTHAPRFSAAPIATASRFTHSSKRRKRPLSKREPLRDEYSDEEDFQHAWGKWREDRDHNNKSVRLSREKAKVRRMQGEQASKNKAKSKHGESLQDKLIRTQKELRLLVQMVKEPDALTETDLMVAEAIINENYEPVAPPSKYSRSGCGKEARYGSGHSNHSTHGTRSSSGHKKSSGKKKS